DRAGVIGAEGAWDLIQAVRTPAADPPTLAAAIELEEIAPAIEQFQIKRAELGLVAPLIPIQAGGKLIRRVVWLPDPARGEIAGYNGVYFADGAIAHEFAGMPVDGHRALLRAGLHDPLVLA